MSAEPQGFEAKLASLQPKNPQGLRACIELSLLELVRFLTCCCCYQCRKPFAFTKPNKREGWSAHRAASCPAQLKVSTIDKRTIEVKITYAENAGMSTQLYEVDVFMFFLKDLEAVTTNFYHDLWQSTRMHTPKVPLASMASGEASDSLSGLIKEQLLVIQYKQLVGNERDASVQQDIDQAVDTLVQQLRLQACMFRQSVRRAMKGITTTLEQVQGMSADTVTVQKLSAQIGTVVQQLAEVVHKLHLLCHPCESEDVPATVRETWMMVDEYMLTEAEIALVKLLESVDQAAPYQSQALDGSDSIMRRASRQPLEDTTALNQHDCSDFRTSVAPGNAPDDRTEAMSHSSITSLSSTDSDCRQQQQRTGPNIAADDKQTRFAGVIGRDSDCHATGLGSALADTSAAAVHSDVTTTAHRSETAASVDAFSQGGQMMRTEPLQSQADKIGCGTLSPAEATCVHSSGRLALSPAEATCVHSPGRPVLLHSSASSCPEAASSTQFLLGASSSTTPDQSTPNTKAQSQSSSWFGSDHLHAAQLTQQSICNVSDSWVSLDKKAAGCHTQQAAAYSLLCDPRKPTGYRESDQPSSINMNCVPEISEQSEEQEEEEEMSQSNMQSLIQKAKALQEASCDDRPSCNDSGTGDCEEEDDGAVQQIAQGLVGARQLIVDAVELLQLNPLYVLITVVAYMMKDRIKEWGKRYLQPVCVKFGFEFPDRIVKRYQVMITCLSLCHVYPLFVTLWLQGVTCGVVCVTPGARRVGRCKEWAKVVGDDQVDARVLAMRHKDLPYVPKLQKATKPERVMTYRKKMEVNWDRLDPRLQCVDGLDDIMRFDLQHFCRRMQPPEEPHYRICTDPRGRKYAQQVQCARVYHINVVLRIRTSTQDRVRDRPYKEKSMQIQRARVIMDQDGIKRLEATDDSVHLKSDRRALHRLSTPEWLADVHMPSMQLPRMQMPHMKFASFGRRLTENKSSSNLPQEEAV
ncbi:MAG: hypothetical protein FRX49_12435 [Trebouxia sp. A1-2]|nr:MAG: hypothetical protein FRX49_12435 [Trebouxia sp. A1-2]